MAEKTLNELQVDIEVLKERVDQLLDAAKQYRELTKEAIDKADAGMDRRLEGMNEFRAQLQQQSATFVTIKEVDALKAGWEVALKQLLEKNDLAIKNVDDKSEAKTSGNTKRIEELELFKSNFQGRAAIIAIAWSVLWGIILIWFSWYLGHT